MPRILKNIRIDEVSACTKGAGVGTRIVLMKRDDSADDFDEWHREQAAIAERQNEEHLREDDEREEREESVRSAARKRFMENWNKAFADDARDETVSAGNDHHASKVADLLVESGKHPDRQAALDHLLHTADGAAMLRRLRKQHEESNSMSTTPEQKLSDLVKRAGITAVAAQIVKADSAFSIDEHTLTQLTIEHAKREHPQLTAAQAFAKVFSAQDEGGVILRKAFNVVKAATFTPIVVDGNADNPDDAREASQALSRLVEEQRARAPWMTAEQLYEEVMRKNPELTVRAFRRPAITSVYPFPR
jgi:hypothetical protein